MYMLIIFASCEHMLVESLRVLAAVAEYLGTKIQQQRPIFVFGPCSSTVTAVTQRNRINCAEVAILVALLAYYLGIS